MPLGDEDRYKEVSKTETPVEEEENIEEHIEESVIDKLSNSDLAQLDQMINKKIKERNAKADNPALERLVVTKGMFGHENQKIEDGDLINKFGEIGGTDANKLINLLRTIEKKQQMKFAGMEANTILSTSVSWHRKGRAEGNEWAKTTSTTNNYGRDPLVPSGERVLGDEGATTRRWRR